MKFVLFIRMILIEICCVANCKYSLYTIGKNMWGDVSRTTIFDLKKYFSSLSNGQTDPMSQVLTLCS